MTNRDKNLRVAQISVRLDNEALAALGRLEATGLTRSEAVRRSLIETASRLSDRKTLAAEVALLEADEEDRAEMLVVADFMEALRARSTLITDDQGAG